MREHAEDHEESPVTQAGDRPKGHETPSLKFDKAEQIVEFSWFVCMCGLLMDVVYDGYVVVLWMLWVWQMKL